MFRTGHGLDGLPQETPRPFSLLCETPLRAIGATSEKILATGADNASTAVFLERISDNFLVTPHVVDGVAQLVDFETRLLLRHRYSADFFACLQVDADQLHA